MREVEQFIRNAERMTMTPAEKAEIRSRLSAYTDAKPLRAPVVSPYVSGSPFSFASIRRYYVQVAAAFVLIAGGGLSAAANGALPGDPLYAMKVNFNEEVTGILAVTPEAKAKREAGLAERRLEEAADLSAQGRLTAEARTSIERNFENHVKNIGHQIEKLEAKNEVRKAVEVSSGLESSLRVHEKVLLDLTNRSDEAAEMASSIRQELTAVSQSLNSLEKKISNEVSPESERQAQQKSLAAEKELNESRRYISEKEGQVDPEVAARARRNLDVSLRHLAEGYTAMERGSYNKAFVSFQKSIRYSTEASLRVTASLEHKIKKPEPEEETPVTEPEPQATTTPSGAVGTSTDPETVDVSGTTTVETATATGMTAKAVLETGASSSDERAAVPGRTGITSGIKNLLRIGR